MEFKDTYWGITLGQSKKPETKLNYNKYATLEDVLLDLALV